MPRRAHHIRRRVVLRAALVGTWTVLALASLVPAAHALGLPFVDLPDAGDVASDAIASASSAIVNLVASSVASLTNEIIKVSDTLGTPQVTSSNAWFTASYKRTMGVSLYLMAIVSLVAIAAAGIRGKVGDMAQVIFVGIPGSVLAMMLATLGVQLALALTDAMTAYTFGSSVHQIQTFLHDIGTTFTSSDPAADAGSQTLAAGLVLIIGLLMVIAQLVILAVLIIRAALIYIVTLFLPLVFAMQVWPATRHMTRKALELLAVLILSKFAIFTCFALGAGATDGILNGSGATAGSASPVQSAIVGFGVMLAAAFSPMLLMSIVPGIAGSFGAGMPGGTAGAGALGMQSPTQIMRSTLASVHTVRGGASSNTTSRSNGSERSSGSSSTTPRPPGASSGMSSPSGSGSSSRGSAAMEQAHGAANAHPAAAASMGATRQLAAGATGAAQATKLTATASTKPEGNAASGRASERANEGPHVVSSRTGSGSESSSARADTRSAAQVSGGQLALPGVDAAAQASPDGFSRVSTSQPFTLETT